MTFAARFIGWVKSLFQAERSLRLRASASAWAYRNVTSTPADTGNKRKTYSMWCKRSALGSVQELVSNYVSTANFWGFYFSSDDRLCFYAIEGGAVQASKFSAEVFRDVAAYMHVMLVTDTANSTAEDRVQIWVNGVRITSWNTNTTPALNAITAAAFIAPGSGTWFLNIGRLANATNYFDGYLAAVVGVDGQALTPSSFGEFDSGGNWRPKAYSGTYGTNGFRLDFSDPTSLTTLLADSSGNGNNWTANNISLTAGATYDSMLDVPLGGGGNERGNYCTLNPLVRHASSCAFAEGNLRMDNSGSTSVSQCASASLSVSAPSYYEVTAWNVAGTIDGAGACGFAAPDVIYQSGGFPGSVSKSFGFSVGGSGNWYKRQDGAASTAIPALNGLANGTVMMIAYDPVNGRAWVGKNGAWNGSGNPATGANPDLTGIAADVLIPSLSIFNNGSQSVQWYVNFGQRPFAHAVPTGFKALHTGNLPDPVIQQPSKHVLARLRTGGGAPDSVSGLPLAPELIWVKGRSAATNHQLFDKVRGAFKSLASNSSAAEQNLGLAGIRSFNPDGYTMGNDTAINTNNAAYVDWLWKAGGAAVANNAGSIASQVSANPQAGFSIATYTGNSANATVGHGLGVTPKLVIVKARTGGATTWVVYHKDANASPASGYLALNDTIAFTANASVWGNVEPTPSNFSVSNNPSSNASGIDYIAYCWAEIPGYSKFGRYNANASADGPFVYCGFRPRFVMIKRTDSPGEWRMYDSARSGINPVDGVLRAEQATAEGISLGLDFTATGFKIRTTDTNLNGGAAPYIFAAFAEAPFKYALAR